MLKDITIGQFFPGNSAVHRLDPRVKIILTVAFIVLLFLAQGPVSYALIIAFLAVIIAISHISPKMVVRGLKPILLIVLFTAVLNLFYTPGDYIWQWKFLHISTQGIRMAIFMVLRLMLLIIATSMLTYTTSPIQLTDGLERLLGEQAGVLEAHRLELKRQVAVMNGPLLRQLANFPFAAARVRAVINCIRAVPDLAVLVSRPDGLRVRTLKNLISPSFDFFSAAAVEYGVVFPVIRDPHKIPSLFWYVVT